MNIILHPFYQYLIHSLLFNYLKLPNTESAGNTYEKFDQKLGIKKDTYYKIEGFAQLSRGVDLNDSGSYTLRLNTLNKIAGILRQCQTWNDLKELYPIPKEELFTNIDFAHYRSLPEKQKEAISLSVRTALANKPPAFRPVGNPVSNTLPMVSKSIPAFTGCYLLVFYVRASRSFRVFPIKIADGKTVELKRNEWLVLNGNLQQRGSNCFMWLSNDDSADNTPITLITTYPENINKLLSYFSLTIAAARNYRSISRHGNGFCFRIEDTEYEQFFQKDEYSETELDTLPCKINPEIKYQLRLYAMVEFDHHSDEKLPNTIALHDSQFYGYFRRNAANSELMKLPICIKNGFVRMKHPLYEPEFTGLLRFNGSVLWIKLKTSYNSNNFTEENFSIQIKVNGGILNRIALENQYVRGLYFATRSADYTPICGDILLQSAEFDYETTSGISFAPDEKHPPELQKLRILDLSM